MKKGNSSDADFESQRQKFALKLMTKPFFVKRIFEPFIVAVSSPLEKNGLPTSTFGFPKKEYLTNEVDIFQEPNGRLRKLVHVVASSPKTV